MEKEQLILRVREILSEEFEKDINDLTPDANIKATLELDSLSLVDMVALIEAEFKVKITGTEVSQVKTFAELYDFIEERLK
ncbi:MAG: acyl carrier protein [Paludibacteraceae bacterium]|nr:acyl carrier protein [Paludibacteraceae bacterium]MBO5345690.1 acyl carrier protein [Paludibacteraceae bacterium]